jgi:plasmid maintenance system antidote protein VapI
MFSGSVVRKTEDSEMTEAEIAELAAKIAELAAKMGVTPSEVKKILAQFKKKA